ncbi:protocadherin Fat 4 isoform X2 [Syngnathoides biaculeatus]|uniref:protocadherin Fat 4 isoform X2 n=1 Tax=Syngnathoides biaculeatus TaxID=300417 RepID=UPI002ADDDC47|nr:protocadherin Fat 4 isoform X2 [Syngnathoides biaculeatus]
MGSVFLTCSLKRYVLLFVLLAFVPGAPASVTHYSIPEEMKEGTIVANIADDLSLDVRTLNKRKMRLDIIANKRYLDVKKETGELYIVEKIDREILCPTKSSASCYLKLEVILENPVRIFNIEVEILDTNDNAPQFRRDAINLDISESTPKGERFSLSNAVDPDVGSNTVKTYHLSESDKFDIEVQTGRDGSKFAELILKDTLDREKQAVHNLILTAVDGGKPPRSGTAKIILQVLDNNDNAPLFDEAIYNVKIMENSPIGSLVIDLNATDLDEGSNSDLTYSYSLYTPEKTQETFNLNPSTGEITVKGTLNYEEFRIYDMEVIAADKGVNSLAGQCTIKIQVEDMNDNHPEISIKSFQSPVSENIGVDSVIAVVSVSDEDSGHNGVVDLRIPPNLPFRLRESSDNYYQLVVSEPLDREKVPEYDITFTVTDRGSPPLSDNETMTLQLLDVNDNVPRFPQPFYNIRVPENNAPGALLTSLSAFDPDLHENQYLVYFIVEKEIANTSMSMLFSINPENGNLYALKTFDYEMEKDFLFHIEARDSGSPPLSSKVSVRVAVADQNDNAPVIVSPWRAHGSAAEEKIPRSTEKGSLVAKVIALDEDSVHNSRITYQFLQVSDASLFSLDQYNGEIRTTRMFSYKDWRHQRLVVVAKDNGQPALSATVTIKLSTVETAARAYSDGGEAPPEYDVFSDLNVYLVIGLGSVSFLLLITVSVCVVLKCQKVKPGQAAPPCRSSVISERNSTLADSTLVSNDAYWYSLFLAETRKGKLVVRQPVPKGSRYFVSSIPRSAGVSVTSDSAPSTLQDICKDVFWTIFFAAKLERPKGAFATEVQGAHTRTMSAIVFTPPRQRYVPLLLVLLLSSVHQIATSVTHYSIPEEMKEGSVVANLAADLGLDVKTLSQRKMRLDIISNKKYLDVNRDTGELFIVEKIDREHCLIKSSASCYLRLEVILENPVRIFNIEVEIVDINDNAPQFRRDAIHLDISESTPKGERFSLSNAVDPDFGSNTVKTYHLSESDRFDIEVQTGRDGSKFAELILKDTLDREKQAVHNLILTAVDGGKPPRSGTAKIIVQVLDNNDNAPLFDEAIYNVKIMENSPIGSLVIDLNATDLDEGSNSDLTYSYSLYTPEKTQETFNLNPATGEITVKGTLNYEEFRIYDMEVIAADKGVNSLAGQCTIKIQVEDMNDNHPEISIKSFQSPVSENIGVDSVIAVVSVSDEDSGHNGVVDLRIPPNLPFRLRESSDNYYQLVVSEPLDREKVPEYDITFTVTDRGSPPLSDNETMTLQLLDVNDNVPRFPQPFYNIRVPENNAPGALLTSLSAFDPDLHENQYLVYFIVEKEIANTSMSMLFSINPENGNLYALKTFDYEMEKDFLFHIEARDSGSPPLSSKVSVRVAVADQNDNAPVIVSPWRAHGSAVEEKIPRSTEKGSLVAKVIALDEDSVHNSRITYQFLQVSDASLFSLDQYNGEIRTTRMFSYKDWRHQRLVVVAKDNGQPALSATVTIKLSTVETAARAYSDGGEAPPEYDVFSDLNVYLVIGLGSVSFLLLITVSVCVVLKCQKVKPGQAAPPCRSSVISERNSTLADSTLVSNDAYWYSLFLAETRKGKLVVRQPVPKGSRYFVSSIPRSAGVSVTSDSAPSTLQDICKDVFWTIFFAAKLERPKGAFATEVQGAHTRTMSAIVFTPPRQRYVPLLLVLLLSSVHQIATSVTHYSIPEEMKEGSVVANLAADLGLDVKTLSQRKMRLDIISNKKYLDVNRDTGELFIVEKIDREHICTTKSSASCYLRLEVILENPLRIFNLEVEIMDMNDNAPKFRRDAIHLDISESTPKGERFSLSNAVDPDVGSNTVKTYHLSESEHFDIEVQTGREGTKLADLILMKILDREKQAVHNLILTAVDGGTPPRSGTASIIVHVLDNNDNAPLFDEAIYNIKIMENSPIGSLVIDLNATDLDEGSNSDLTYSYSLYTPEKTQETFNLNPATGEITVKGTLNYEEFRIYDMEVIAADKGVNSLAGQCTIKIQVEDMNDNHPEISIKSFQSPVSENIGVDSVIAVVSVSDEDSGHNGVVDLRIPPNLPFRLRESSDNYYQLVVSEPLDREKVPEYDITFTVTDRGSPPLSDNETMTLQLLDVNDNVPRFPQPFYNIRVPENNAPGALLTSLSAFDPDLHENQYLVYFIVEKEIANTSMSMLFSINPENGNLYALKTFDYEMEKDFLFHIEARDSGSPPLSSKVSVRVAVADQNDNAPVIVSPWRAHGSAVEEKIPRSTEKGSLVAKVIALDEDSVHNSRITYQFLQVSDASLFSLDQYNGEIRTTRMFSYKDWRHQRLVVVAKDNGQPALSATVTIKLSTVETAARAYSDGGEAPPEYDVFSDLNVYLVIGLGSVSFLLLITVSVCVVLKCQKVKPGQAAPPCRSSVISERNSTLADSTLVSNDAYWYSLFLAETRKGKLVVRQPVPKGSRYFVSSIPRSAGVSVTSDSAPSTLQYPK